MEITPLGERPSQYPFSSMVLNINAVTDGHRDSKDDRYCVVIPIGDFQDGELILYEPRISIALRSCNPIIFDSRGITHLNQHYSGYRSSLVLHVDEALSAYRQTRANWHPSNFI